MSELKKPKATKKEMSKVRAGEHEQLEAWFSQSKERKSRKISFNDTVIMRYRSLFGRGRFDTVFWVFLPPLIQPGTCA